MRSTGPIHGATIAATFALLVTALAGCTTTTIRPEIAVPPSESYHTVAIGEFTAADELWQLYLPHLRSGLVDKLKEQKVFTEVLDPVPSPLPASTIVVSGTLTEVDKGSAALRWIVGFGAGRSHATAAIEITEAGGKVMAKFSSRKAYSGGAGIGGAGLLDMEDLVRKLGEQTAESVGRWSKGGPIEPPS